MVSKQPCGLAEQNISFQSSKTSLTREEHFNSALAKSSRTSPTLSSISLLNLARKLCSHLPTHRENILAKGQKLTIPDNLDISRGYVIPALPKAGKAGGEAVLDLKNMPPL